MKASLRGRCAPLAGAFPVRKHFGADNARWWHDRRLGGAKAPYSSRTRAVVPQRDRVTELLATMVTKAETMRRERRRSLSHDCPSGTCCHSGRPSGRNRCGCASPEGACCATRPRARPHHEGSAGTFRGRRYQHRAKFDRPAAPGRPGRSGVVRLFLTMVRCARRAGRQCGFQPISANFAERGTSVTASRMLMVSPGARLDCGGTTSQL